VPEIITCPNGHDNPADKAYCGVCGAPLFPNPPASSPPPSRSRRTALVAGGIAVALLAVIAGVAVGVASGGGSDGDPNGGAASSPTVAASASPSSSPVPATTFAEAEGALCGDLAAVSAALEGALALTQPGTTTNDVARAAAELKAVAATLRSDAALFDEAGDVCKAEEVRAFAQALDDQADGFTEILGGDFSGAYSLVPLLRPVL
jgi:hypothetical protein